MPLETQSHQRLAGLLRAAAQTEDVSVTAEGPAGRTGLKYGRESWVTPKKLQ